MIRIRKADQRGHADHGWLDTYHTFSFASYYDPAHRGFRSLRVINEDRVAAGHGFGMHEHADMEIVSYVLDGALEHKDSMGNGEVLHPGEFQRISAGSGIAHSEFNPSKEKPTHFYQIWLYPHTKGLAPSYEQKRFEPDAMHNQLRLVASPTGADGSLTIHQDARIYLARLDAQQAVSIPLESSRHAWLQVLRGAVTLNGHSMSTSDGAAVSDETRMDVATTEEAEIMLFDLI